MVATFTKVVLVIFTIVLISKILTSPTFNLLKSSIVFSGNDIEHIKYIVSTLYNDCTINSTRIFTKNDLYTTVKNNVTDINDIVDVDTNTTEEDPA